MATILFCHGAWSGEWSWRRVRPLLEAKGHTFHMVTYTGLGDRAHLMHPGVNLSTHIQDILSLADAEELNDVVLVGHSYGGMVATGVGAALGDRVRQMIYLDAFVPDDGQAVFDIVPAPHKEAFVNLAVEKGDGWKVHPNPPPPGMPPEEEAWLLRHRFPMPMAAFCEPVRYDALPDCPKAYIHCTKKDGPDVFARYAEKLGKDPAWQVVSFDSTHSPNLTAREEFVDLLDRMILR